MMKHKVLDPAEIELYKMFFDVDCNSDLLESGILYRKKIKEYIRNKINSCYHSIYASKSSNSSLFEVDVGAFGKKLINYPLKIKQVDTLRSLGSLIAGSDFFLILVNSNISKRCQRYSIAHEIGHIFFYDLKSKLPTINFTKSQYYVQEGYADEISRQILVPEPQIDKSSLANEPNLKNFISISNIFNVPGRVARIRLVKDLRVWDCVIFTSEYINNKNRAIITKPTSISKSENFKKLSIPMVINLNQIKNELNALITENIVQCPRFGFRVAINQKLKMKLETANINGAKYLCVLSYLK